MQIGRWVNCDKMMHAPWDFDAQTQRASELEKCENLKKMQITLNFETVWEHEAN